MPGIILLGLGPGDPEKITRESWEILKSAKEVWLRTDQHPVVKYLPSTIKIHSFDHLYEKSGSFEKVYEKIVKTVLNQGKSLNGVIYAVPGDPFVAEATCPEIARQASDLKIPVKIINGLSFLEPVFSTLRVDPFPRMALIDAMELSVRHVPDFPPDFPALISQLYSRLIAAEVKMTLSSVYPDEHPVRLIHAAGTKNEKVENLPLYKIDRSKHIGLLTVLYLPPLGSGTSFESFQEIIARLRAPDGCPWDREQTHATLRAHILEETYETLEAIDLGDSEKIAEELGDLLLQIVLNAQIASEEGEFGISDTIKNIHDKIIRRHPHVFGKVKVKNVEGVLTNWENIKASEREVNLEPGKGILDGVPNTLPALSQAQEIQERAARVGFDWPDISGVLDKISEEITEINDAIDSSEFASEMGDLFFALVNFSRWKNLDTESVLREANTRFKRRFAFIERESKQKNRQLSDMSLDEMETLWQKAKKTE